MIVKHLSIKQNGIAGIGKGRFFRVLKSSYPIEIRTYTASGETQSSELLANTGGEFKPFARAEITSAYAQTIIVAYSDLPIFDNRLGVDDNTLLRVDGNRTATGLPALVAGVAGEVLTVPANPDRKSLVLQAAASNGGKLWAGGNGSEIGLPVSANDTLTVEVKKPFQIYATNAGDKIYLLEVV